MLSNELIRPKIFSVNFRALLHEKADPFTVQGIMNIKTPTTTV